MLKVKVDVLLTDFRQWLACVYMAKSVQDLPVEIQHFIEIHEWDMRTLEGNSRFLQLKGKYLPSIALDDELVYESLIPGQEELIAIITKLWLLKNTLESVPPSLLKRD